APLNKRSHRTNSRWLS
ncbi:unnamed protein product, partial [Allacma fusca]